MVEEWTHHHIRRGNAIDHWTAHAACITIDYRKVVYVPHRTTYAGCARACDECSCATTSSTARTVTVVRWSICRMLYSSFRSPYICIGNLVPDSTMYSDNGTIRDDFHSAQ